MQKPAIEAEIRLPTQELREDLAFYTTVLGMQLDMIFPADNPRVARVSGHGLNLRLEKGAPETPGTIRILTDNPAGFAQGARNLTAPNGTHIKIVELSPPLQQPETEHAFVVRRLEGEAPWIIGRAGMHYRDLIPSRLGGSIIASHIRIPDGGPVPDMVHYHRVGFQLIYCYKGWVDVLYEDQGDEMMRLHAGDCVIQPPEIRHRVCYASPDIEVIEIGVPAEHITTIDHDMILPNGFGEPSREWQGQRFVHHVKDGAVWQDFRLPGFTCRDTGIAMGTKGIASIKVARHNHGGAVTSAHSCDILFSFVLEGSMSIEVEGQETRVLQAGDAFVIPPELVVKYADFSPDLEILEAALPAEFKTSVF